MLYKQNKTEKLDPELFRNPTSEYRGTPFWSWNCTLEKEELTRQLEVFKKMGFGGAHMHVRTGLATPYLSDEFMDMVKACVEKAKKEEMLAWLYDEDRFPSGAAGGLVTKDEQYRCRYLLFTPRPYCGEGRKIEGEITLWGVIRSEDGKLLNCYDVELDDQGYLKSWRVIGEDEPAEHEKWYAYLEINKETPWYNNQTYVDTLNKAAIERFVEVTHERYRQVIGEEFDKAVPAIFTDEPEFTFKTTLSYAKAKEDVYLPWTDDLAETFAEASGGKDLMASLPELFWERADGRISEIRYLYHDHLCDRFVEAFADTCGDWCREHNLALTGHMMREQTLQSQTAAVGEVMRSYRGFGLPGIDMLGGAYEYTTAKQCQSAVHQLGSEGMLSELYGVTNWDYEFRDYKQQGDWQAALGVTVRVPHLSHVSLAGEAKRDWPGSISYQSPWWEKFSLVEDHFARVNTALTRGKPIVKVGVIHPIESFWLHWGPSDQTALDRDNLDKNFQDIIEWLLFGGIDFDFISEALLPQLCKEASAPLQVGEMAYDVILVPGCETLRSTTLERLEAFAEAGGRVIFAGEVPTLENAVPSERGAVLAAETERTAFTKGAVLKALQNVRIVEIRNATGALTENLLYNLRSDGDGRWLFIAPGKNNYSRDVSKYQDMKIRISGAWNVTLFNTLNGEQEGIDYSVSGDVTEVRCRMYDYDSLLLWLEPAKDAGNTDAELFPEISGKVKEASDASKASEIINATDGVSKTGDASSEGDASKAGVEVVTVTRNVPVPLSVPYTLDEPNVLLLDQAEYALDDEEWVSCDGVPVKEEILRIDDACRDRLGWPRRKHNVAQPWVVKEDESSHTLHLRWRIQSEIAREDILLAIEDAERLAICWNGQAIDNTVIGWYVDKAIKTVKLPSLKPGENILEVTVPYGKRTDVEWAYLLGDFGVEVCGSLVRVVEPRGQLAFGNLVVQGLPFYGGNITYHIPVETKGGELSIRSGLYRGGLQVISVDGGEEVPLIYAPYTASLGVHPAGEHTVDVTLYGNRRNSFGPVHFTDRKNNGSDPNKWRTTGELWSYDYQLKEVGVLSTPVITEKLL